MIKKYLLIQPYKQSDSIKWLSEEEITDINQLMRDRNIKKFLNELPKEPDPFYWSEEEAMLLEVKILKVKSVEVVEKWQVEGIENAE